MRALNYPINAQGVWCEISAPIAAGRPALFLDRDGAVIEDTGYLCRVEDIVMIEGAAAVIAAANAREVAVVLVTNQAGIGRGLYGWSEFRAVQDAIVAALAAQGARFNAVYACPHHPDGQGGFAQADHPARKPNPGMLLQAAADLALDLKQSWLVGDRATDIEAAKHRTRRCYARRDRSRPCRALPGDWPRDCELRRPARPQHRRRRRLPSTLPIMTLPIMTLPVISAAP